MARIQLELPATFPFATEIPIRITDINYGGHLGNDSLLSLLHEARVRYLKNLGFSEVDVGGCGIMTVDAAISYRKEVFAGDTLHIEVGIADLQRAGFDVVYRVTKAGTGELVAEAKTGTVFFDYQKRKITRGPEKFVATVTSAGSGQ